MERIPLGEMKTIGKWSRQKVEFPKSYGFKTPVAVEIERPEKMEFGLRKLDKQSNRNNVFSELHCVWKLPTDESNIISDGIRINDDLLVASVNPPRLYHCKDFMDTESVILLIKN